MDRLEYTWYEIQYTSLEVYSLKNFKGVSSVWIALELQECLDVQLDGAEDQHLPPETRRTFGCFSPFVGPD